MKNSINQTLRQMASKAGLAFARVLSVSDVERAVELSGIRFRNRVFPPYITLLAFLQQCIDGQSCREAVLRVLVHRAASGAKVCSARTGGYVLARQRLPRKIPSSLARSVARRQEAACPDEWLWRGHHVKIIDGSSVLMPDTDENMAAYPHHSSIKVGFPIARTAAVFSLATACVLDFRMAPMSGKGTGEQSLFFKMWSCLNEGDVVLGDRYYSSYWCMALLKGQRNVDFVFRTIEATPRKGIRTRIGKDDCLLQLTCPAKKPSWYRGRPIGHEFRTMTVREIKFRVRDKTKRSREVCLLTSLTDHHKYPKEAIADLYEKRWNVELDFRTLKSEMGMDMLRCKTPAMCQKEIWTTVLAYNLIRSVSASAAEAHDKQPRQISFEGTRQTSRMFAPFLIAARPDDRKHLVDVMLLAIASHPVANRPGRSEPRAVKRRPKWDRWLKVSRSEARRDEMIKNSSRN